MDFGAVIEIILAVLAMVGIACLVKYISDVFFLPREISSTIKIFDDGARENADILLDVAKRRAWNMAGRETLVLISNKYAEDETLLSLINESGFDCYIIDELRKGEDYARRDNT